MQQMVLIIRENRVPQDTLNMSQQVHFKHRLWEQLEFWIRVDQDLPYNQQISLNHARTKIVLGQSKRYLKAVPSKKRQLSLSRSIQKHWISWKINLAIMSYKNCLKEVQWSRKSVSFWKSRATLKSYLSTLMAVEWFKRLSKSSRKNLKFKKK